MTIHQTKCGPETGKILVRYKAIRQLIMSSIFTKKS